MIFDKKTVQDFENWIEKYYDFDIVPLENIGIVRRFRWWMRRLGVRTDKFIAITLGRKVCVKDLDVLRFENPRRYIQLLMHEARHRCQNIHRERRFYLQYIFNKKKRADYEGDCMTLDIDFKMWQGKTVRLKTLSARLANDYRCGEDNASRWMRIWAKHINDLNHGKCTNGAEWIWNRFLERKKR